MKNKGQLTTEKEFGFKVKDGAFNASQARDQLSDRKRAFSKRANENNATVAPLDRYDDFSALKIGAEVYAEKNGYGIAPKDNGDDTIYAHQEKAARSFLRDLRGFGLLADVVGSGKTYEAGVILSELAIQGKIESMLVVVPEQVYGAWIKVLEHDFGLGKDTLMRANMECSHCGHKVEAKEDETVENLTDKSTSPEFCEKCGESLRFENNIPPLKKGTKKPSRPVIVKMEDFARWSKSASELLFDVIVVDEAHNLCQADGVYANAMKLLSQMMATKKKANSTFCILLSATPHSGNLENMFRLWYFIRCQGGKPEDFDLVEEKRSADYQTEKKYYIDHVCHGSTTVMEFIQNVKEEVLVTPTSKQYPAFVEYLNKTRRESIDDFFALTRGERRLVVSQYLRDNPTVRVAVEKKVADEYHNGLLRSIMIRGKANITKVKFVHNYYFYPAIKTEGEIETEYHGEKISINLGGLLTDRAIKSEYGLQSVDKFVGHAHGVTTPTESKAEILIGKVFNATVDDSRFIKKNYSKYYASQFMEVPDTLTDTSIIPFSSAQKTSLESKIEKAKEIIQNNENKRVLIFFDYELKKDQLVFDEVESILCQDPKIKNRLITGTAFNKKSVVEKFHKKQDAILLIKDQAFTEGVNLQCCNIIINFQVSPDPLTMDQRVGRIFRLGQRNNVHIYSFADMSELEGFALAYYSRIGLMSSNSGDATIIAGSNNECMRTVRCHVCGNVELLTQEEYEQRKKKGELYCTTTSRCRENDSRGTAMEEICVYDFKCDTCGRSFTRSVAQEGYACMSVNNDNKGIMCSRGEQGDRKIYCTKICAMAHCDYFNTPEMKGKCDALKAYASNKSISDADLMTLCENCKNKACMEKCKFNTGPEAVSACRDCRYATCSPKPYSIDFNDKWEASCPNCEEKEMHGTIRPVVARTFAAYLRNLWNFNYDGGKSFCDNLLKEANKVADIKKILTLDGEK
ncbi:MAG: DEAD/DEAH box helicase [Clostridia bacterium]|nr:DEAD/DEAH box helicase [Clostridia bacterium]